MKTITVKISDDIMKKLQEQDQPLQTLLLQALNDYLQKSLKTDVPIENLTKANIEELYDDFQIDEAISNGQRMADSLNQIAMASSLTQLDPISWQKEIRGDRQLPNRD